MAMNTLIHEGYRATVAYDADADLFHGEIVNLRDVVTFQATSEADLPNALADSVEDYRAFCKERGEAAQQP